MMYPSEIIFHIKKLPIKKLVVSLQRKNLGS